MEYIKIRADFKYAEKGRLYRTFLVAKDMGLFELGCHIVSALNGTMEHCFLFRHGKTEMVQAPFMEDPFPGIKFLWMGQYRVEDLPERFDFEYDTGDGWYFCCKKYKKTVVASFDSSPRIVILEGAGQGIWEDNIGTLYAYFDGMLDPNAKAEQFEDEENGYYLPWNVSIEKWGDYDAPLDTSTFQHCENPDWEGLWQNELAYAKKLKLDKAKKDPRPFQIDIDEFLRFQYFNMLADIFPYAFNEQAVFDHAREKCGKKWSVPYQKAFKEEFLKRFDEKDAKELFAAIEKHFDDDGKQ